MTIKKLLVLSALTAAFTTIVLIPRMISGATPAPAQKPVVVPTLTHKQNVWKNALEWCESRGDNGAINPKDRDNTPSYGGYQFKPSTLTYYARLYGVATTSDVIDYAVQDAVVIQMILHRKEINWHQQFPDCVKRLGLPPAGVQLK